MHAAFIIFLILGAVFGSFGGVILMRLPKGESITGRSHCDGCGKHLSVLELIPLLSFLIQKGRCSHCKKQLSWTYPLLELCSIAIFLIALHHEGGTIVPALLLALALWSLFFIALTDAFTQSIPDLLNGILLVTAIGYTLALNTFDWRAPALGLAFFGGQWLLSRGRWVGSGDVFLSLGMGFLLQNWRSMVLALFLAYILGALYVCILLMLGKKKMADYTAFGPFLIIGTVVTFFWSSELLQIIVPL